MQLKNTVHPVRRVCLHVSVNERPEVINSEFWLLIFYKTLTTRARDLAHDEKLQPRNFLKSTKI